MRVKVLTLHAPYGPLIRLGVKVYETRPQPMRPLVGQRIAVHTAARWPQHLAAVGDWTVLADGEVPALRRRGDVEAPPIPMPLGVIECTALVTDCLPMVAAADERRGERRLVVGPPAQRGVRRFLRVVGPSEGDPHEYADDQVPYGDYRPGRWALALADVEPLAVPMPFKGGQGLSRSIDVDELAEWQAAA
jgi:hypothetical protein